MPFNLIGRLAWQTNLHLRVKSSYEQRLGTKLRTSINQFLVCRSRTAAIRSWDSKRVPSPLRREGAEHGPVFEFLVPDVNAAKTRLMAAGCTVEEEDASLPRCYIRDPYGVVFNIGRARAVK